MPLPRDIRRKLSALGRPKEPEGREGERPPEPDRKSEAAERCAPARAEASDLSDLSRKRLKDRVQRRFEADGPDEPEPDFGPARTLEQVLAGEVIENEFGCLYRARLPAAEIGPASELAGRLADTLQRTDLASLHTELVALTRADPARIVFLDTETTGLTSVPLFLCGTMTCADGEFLIELMLARDYAEEAALLRHVQSELQGAEVLITYNGRTFDLPYIHDRMVYHFVEYRYEGEHIDLLPHARRLYKGTFPDCKLQTLEVRLCGYPERTGDIPGDAIPQAYHDFVASSNASLLAPIFRHNARDLIVLCDVLLRVIDDYGR